MEEPLGNKMAFYALNEKGEPEMVGFKKFGMVALKEMLLEFFSPERIEEHLDLEGYAIKHDDSEYDRQWTMLTVYCAQDDGIFSLYEAVAERGVDCADEKPLVVKRNLATIRNEIEVYLKKIGE